MTVEEMTALDLAYAPPFSPVWDPILVAARQASAAVRAAPRAHRGPQQDRNLGLAVTTPTRLARMVAAAPGRRRRCPG
jgi:hypothetical protein